jgi:arylsulfatase
MMVETGGFITQTQIGKGSSDFIEMKDVRLPGAPCDFVPFCLSGSKRIFPFWVEMERTDLTH